MSEHNHVNEHEHEHMHVPHRVYSSRTRTALWGITFLAFILVPVGVYLAWGSSADPTITKVSVSLGLIGLSLLLTSFAISRVRILTNHLGIEVVLYAHRAIGVTGVLFILAHIIVAVEHSRWGIRVLNPVEAPARVLFAETATIALILSVSLALTRRRRSPRYEGWRLWHLILAWTIVVASGIHIILLGRLTMRATIKWWLFGDVLALTAIMIFRWLWRPLRARRYHYVVDSVRQDGPESVTLRMHACGHRGEYYKPGQFAWLKFGRSPFVFEEHPFTIASGSEDPRHKEVTIKALGDYTEIISALRPGRKVYLDGPHGRFTVDGAHMKQLVFIGAGIGVTPMMSMLRTLAERRDKRSCLFIVAARTINEIMFRPEVTKLKSKLKLTVVEALTQPPEKWDGECGRVDRELLSRQLPHVHQRHHSDYFVCGPPLMVASVVQALEELDISNKRVHTELFDMV